MRAVHAPNRNCSDSLSKTALLSSSSTCDTPCQVLYVVLNQRKRSVTQQLTDLSAEKTAGLLHSKVARGPYQQPNAAQPRSFRHLVGIRTALLVFGLWGEGCFGRDPRLRPDRCTEVSLFYQQGSRKNFVGKEEEYIEE